jgi:cbb3-type cytochrome oxidase subunit 1
MGLWFIRIAVVYLFVGALLGLVMGITQRFTLVPVHAHVLLLGWASLALAGVVYHLYPAASRTRLARLHFWLHNAGLPVFMIGLGLLLSGTASLLPIVAGAAVAVVIGLALFALNVLVNAKATA